MKMNFGWLMGCAVAAVVVAVGAGEAQAWHKGHPHNDGHYWKKSQAYNSHNKWKSQQHYDGHSYKKSQYKKKKYYHRTYGSWGGHPNCVHLGPFGVCEY